MVIKGYSLTLRGCFDLTALELFYYVKDELWLFWYEALITNDQPSLPGEEWTTEHAKPDFLWALGKSEK